MYKTVTHLVAIAVAAVSGFLATPAGIALLRQYPHLVPIVAGIAGIAATYHSPWKQ